MASVSINIPAPTKGLVTAKNQADMLVDEALLMDNWFPDQDSVKIRKGYISWATGMTGAVETLIPYSSPTNNKLLACANNRIYDASANAAVGAAIGGPYSNNRWQWTMMGTAGGNFAVLVNGTDTGLIYDGTTLSNSTVTGFNTALASDVFLSKQRIFFLEKNSLRFWYLAAGAIGGAASSFDLGSLARFGGTLVCGGTWSRDSGGGLQDLTVFFTSNGEVFAYQGDNPSSASSWVLVTTIRTGVPLGNRCLAKIGPDLCLLTGDGFVPLSNFLSFGELQSTQNSITGSIQPTFRDLASQYKTNFGWQVTQYPRAKMCVINVPLIASSSYTQYVLNTDCGSWCRFTNINAVCWGVLSDELYFGGTDGKVYKADTGYNDNGNFITAEYKTAFNYYGDRENSMMMKLVRPYVLSQGNVQLGVDVNMDFSDTAVSATTYGTNTGTGTAWDAGAWDTTPWGDDATYTKDWYPVYGYGQCAAIRVKAVVKDKSVRIFSKDVLLERGGIL